MRTPCFPHQSENYELASVFSFLSYRLPICATFLFTEEINYFMPLIKEGVLILVFPPTMAVTILQVIFSKIFGLVLDSQLFSTDTTRLLLVLCGRLGAITVGSMCGLVLMAWVMECPGVMYPLRSLKRVGNYFLQEH